MSVTLVVVAVVGALALWSPGQGSPSRTDSAAGPTETGVAGVAGTAATTTTAPPPKVLRLVATGDWLPHETLDRAARTADGGYDFMPMLTGMDGVFAKADVRFCNQSVLAAGPAFGITGYPVFNAPFEFTRDMARVGCNLINAGTNHTNDKNQAAIDASVGEWDKYPSVLAVAGANRSLADQQAVRYFTAGGVRFAFVSYTTYTNNVGQTRYGLTRWDDALVTRQVTEARAASDIVIASVRWGTEYSPGITPAQDAWAQRLSDLGVDIVLGHGSHVLGPVKVLTNASTGRQTTVWFSLGNFLNAQTDTESLFGGFAVMDIDLATKRAMKPRLLPFYVHYDWTAAEKARGDLFARKNFRIYLLENAAEPLSRSVLKTTVDEQRARMSGLVNQYAAVPLIAGKDL